MQDRAILVEWWEAHRQFGGDAVQTSSREEFNIVNFRLKYNQVDAVTKKNGMLQQNKKNFAISGIL